MSGQPHRPSKPVIATVAAQAAVAASMPIGEILLSSAMPHHATVGAMVTALFAIVFYDRLGGRHPPPQQRRRRR